MVETSDTKENTITKSKHNNKLLLIDRTKLLVLYKRESYYLL